jgi:glycosyltransferase involved in cell wall biosynthesis
MSEPLVSAIVIFLNAEAFIAESIESILAQTYGSIEVILVDDGSSDGSTAIASGYAERCPDRIRLLNHPNRENRGMSASRNLGAEHARGRYIAFLDSDDVWLPEKTEQQLAIFHEHPELGMVYGRTQIWYSWEQGQSPARDFFYPLGVAADAIYRQPELLAQLVENKFQSPTTCNAMVSRAAFDRVGGFEDRFRTMYEDQVFFSKIYLNFPTYISDCYWARYRQHQGNTGNHFSRSSYFRERAALMEFIFRYAGPYWPTLDARTRALIRRDRWRARHPTLATGMMWLKAQMRKRRLWHRD